MAEQSITLAPGGSQAVSFDFTPQAARTFQVVVNGLAGSFTCTVRCPPRGTIIYPYYSDTPMETRQAAWQAVIDAWYATCYKTGYGCPNYLQALKLQCQYGVTSFSEYYAAYCHELAMGGAPTSAYPTPEQAAGWFGLTAADLESGCF